MLSSITTYTYTTNMNGKIIVTVGNSRTTVSFIEANGNTVWHDVAISSWTAQQYMFTCIQSRTGYVHATPYNSNIRPVISW